MRRLFSTILLLAAVLCASAQDSTQTLRFGYLSYEAALRSMPDYATVQMRMANLRDQYQAEAKRVEDEFNHKYEEFLDGQRDFPQTILQKRQSELQELMARNIAFKEESRRLLQQAEDDELALLKNRLSEVLAQIGGERGYALIINTDGNACPYINPQQGEDINQLVQDALQ